MQVSIFREMAGWGEGATPWDSTRSSACLLLMLLLKPSADEATKVSQRFSPTKGHLSASTVQLAPMVQLEEVDTLLGYLQRKKVLNKGSVLILRVSIRALLTYLLTYIRRYSIRNRSSSCARYIYIHTCIHTGTQ